MMKLTTKEQAFVNACESLSAGDMSATASAVMALVRIVKRLSEREGATETKTTAHCCSSISPCEHQRTWPDSVCDICKRATGSAAPAKPARCGSFPFRYIAEDFGLPYEVVLNYTGGRNHNQFNLDALAFAFNTLSGPRLVELNMAVKQAQPVSR